MYKILCLIFVLSSFLVSCGNKKVKEQKQEEFTLAELGLDSQDEQDANSSDSQEPEKPIFREWKFWHPKDEFGDVNENVKIITIYLDGYRPSDKDEKDRISIDYCYNINTEKEFFIFSSTQFDSYSEVSFKMQDGSHYVFQGANTGGNLYGAVTFDDIDDMKNIAAILNEGNFKLKVGGRVTEVTNETRGFHESVEKYFKDDNIEILLSRITRE